MQYTRQIVRDVLQFFKSRDSVRFQNFIERGCTVVTKTSVKEITCEQFVERAATKVFDYLLAHRDDIEKPKKRKR